MNAEDRSQSTQAGWDAESLCAPHARQDKARRVRDMFNAIAPTYERVNTLATAGRDAVWRRRAVDAAGVRHSDVVVDVACGTGDMIRAFARHAPPPEEIIGIDFAREMLDGGRYEGIDVPIRLVEADALNLPLDDASADVVSCAFGVRNFQSLQAGLDEMSRIARPGGRAVILEFAPAANPVLRWVFDAYCNTVLPRLGRLVARDQVKAYEYLPRSVQTFESVRSMITRLEDAGFEGVTARRMHLGGVALYVGHKPG